MISEISETYGVVIDVDVSIIIQSLQAHKAEAYHNRHNFPDLFQGIARAETTTEPIAQIGRDATIEGDLHLSKEKGSDRK